MEVLASGIGFLEGPVLSSSGDIITTAIDQGRLYRISDSGISVIAETGGGPNGATEGADGRIFIAQNGGDPGAEKTPGMTGGIQVVDLDGRVSWISQDPISPNDLCFGPDGMLYVTDPSRPRQPANNEGRLWRIDPISGESELLAALNWYPNGIGFGLEDDVLYVAGTDRQAIVRFPLADGLLGEPDIAIQLREGYPDGFAFDAKGNLVVAATSLDERPGQIQTWSPSGELLRVLVPGEGPLFTNVALSLSGTLIVTDSSGSRLLAVPRWSASGLLLHPFRSVTTKSSDSQTLMTKPPDVPCGG